VVSERPSDFSRRCWVAVSTPRVINVDQNAAYPGAIQDLKQAEVLLENGLCRPVKYLTNIVEQDHRFIKRSVKPGLGFHFYPTAWRTLQAYEIMHLIRKGQVRGLDQGDRLAQKPFIEGCLASLHQPESSF
ncbi:MAG: DDE-type integrase/transposase/recombinase, partial [Chloroflexi bacterium]|nr:DDE-type integrase/transposase/recombinase [Chloroflexota bacterium]